MPRRPARTPAPDRPGWWRFAAAERGRADRPKPDRAALVRFGVLIALVAGVGTVAAVHGLDRRELYAVVDRHGALAPLFAIAASALMVAALAPRTALAFVGGAVFGPLAGTGYVILGVTGGAAAAYGIGRVLGRDFVATRLRGRLALVEQAVAGGGLRAVVICRLIPLVPFGVSNYAFGTSSVPLRAFLSGTALGVVPATVGYAALGSATIHGDPAGVGLAGTFVAALAIAGSLGTYLVWRRRPGAVGVSGRIGRLDPAPATAAEARR